ncbi:MAG: hypothetical protein RL095_1194 [Verrucomicrobiota bacterium]|jgi:hypothetical protein
MITNRSFLVFPGIPLILLPWVLAWLLRQIAPELPVWGSPWTYYMMMAIFVVAAVFCGYSDEVERRFRFPAATITHSVWGALSRSRGKEYWCGERHHPELGSMRFTFRGAAEPKDAQFASLNDAWEKLTEVDGRVKAHPEYRGEKLLGLYVSLESWSPDYDLGLTVNFEEDGSLGLFRFHEYLS